MSGGICWSDPGFERFDEAEREYREYLRAMPASAVAHYNLGLALVGQNKEQEAATEFAKAVELNPDFEDARRKLQTDGAYDQRVSLYLPGQEWISMTLTPADKADRYHLWSRVAGEVDRTGAEAILTIFEMSSRKPAEGQRLVLAAETADGRHRTFSASIERRGSQLNFGRTRFDEDGRRWYFLDPIREVWNKPK